MRANLSPVHSWLSLRVRLFCGTAFLLSLFLPPYVDDVALTAPGDLDFNARSVFLAEDGFLLKTSALTEQGTRSAFSQGIIHTVEPGESIASIAKSSQISPDTVRWANGLDSKAQIKSGMKLLILPVNGIIHKVKRGQNLKTIADLYGVSQQSIASQNKILGGYLLAGQDLIILDGKPIIEAAPKPSGKPIAQKPPTVAATKKPASLPTYTIEPSYGILQFPCDCFSTQYFSRIHFGIDLQHKGGSPVFAAEAGTVIRADYGWNGGYGNVIVIDHGNGLKTLYAHNKELYVVVGDTVARGQPIAFMGNSGRVHGPTGIHLHFEVHKDGVKKNPMIYLAQ